MGMYAPFVNIKELGKRYGKPKICPINTVRSERLKLSGAAVELTMTFGSVTLSFSELFTQNYGR